MESTTYTAPAISCEHCQRAIESAVGALAGVQEVHVEIPSKRVEVRFDPARVSAEQIEAVMDEEGYPVQR
jgi:copper ion binding protein